MSRNKRLRIRRRDESKHFLAVGDTGVGKTQFIKQLLYYAQYCGDSCVVLDSKLELLPEFYDPARGDKILSPKDNRCVTWDIGSEVIDEADAISVTRALYPSHPNNPHAQFFDDQACKIAAFLLTHSSPRPTCAEFARWLAHPEEIYKRVRGTEHEHTLDKNAAPQKAGILGTLNQVGYALRMMPDDAIRERFTIREWAAQRNGWLFLPNTAETREALRPLQSAWADMAMLRVMSSQTPGRRVWIVLDELDSLNTLPKLTEGMTMMRSTGHVLVLGMQNTSQLEDRYGRQANTIFSQAGTKMILAVSESNTAKSLQDLFGEVEIRRYRESRTGSFFGKHDRNNFSGPEDIRKPLLLASEIQGLPDLTGYFCQRPCDGETGLHVVKVKLPYQPPVRRHPALIERTIPPWERGATQDEFHPESLPATQAKLLDLPWAKASTQQHLGLSDVQTQPATPEASGQDRDRVRDERIKQIRMSAAEMGRAAYVLGIDAVPAPVSRVLGGEHIEDAFALEVEDGRYRCCGWINGQLVASELVTETGERIADPLFKEWRQVGTQRNELAELLDATVEKIMDKHAKNGVWPDMGGPPVTRFICAACKSITSLEGILDAPAGACPECGGPFASAGGEYIRNTVLNPYPKEPDAGPPLDPHRTPSAWTN